MTGYNPRRINDKAPGIGLENCSNAVRSHTFPLFVPVLSHRKYETSPLVKSCMFREVTLKVVNVHTPSKI